MKNILLTIIMMLLTVMSYSQLKVESNGNIKVRNTGTAATQAIDIDGSIVTGQCALPSFFDQNALGIYNPTANAGKGSGAYINIPNNSGAFGGFAVGYAGAPNWLFGLSKNIADPTGLVFYEGSLASQARFTIATGGNIGIGTNAPTTLLEVNGIASKPGGGAWAVASDKRLKKDISKFKEGLEQVLSFNPVTFKYNGKGGISDTETEYVGLIAQEAMEVAPYMVSKVERITTTESGTGTEYREKVKSQDEFLSVDPSALPYLLINAIQEQQLMIDSQSALIDDLTSKMEKLLSANTNVINSDLENLSIAKLSDAFPNPTNDVTNIEYVVPVDASNSLMNVFDETGRLIKSINIEHTGSGSLRLNAGNVPSGLYTYQLIVDGNVIGSKKVVVTK